MEESEEAQRVVPELDLESNREPETGTMATPVLHVGVLSGSVNSGSKINATHSTFNFGMQTGEGSSSSTTPVLGVKREEWTLLEKEYEDDGWLRPIPWDPKCRLDPEDYFVPLTLDYLGKDGLKTKSVKAELGNIFDCPVKGGAKRARMVLLRGGGGFGKTTLCTKVAYDWKWEKNAIEALPYDKTLIVFYKLKYFDSVNDFEEVMFRYLYEKYSPEEKTEDATRKCLRALGKDLVFFLDGYDELNREGQKKIDAFIEACRRGEGSTFAEASLLVTSRPSDRAEFLDLFEKHYTIGKLPRDVIEKLVLKYFDGESSECEVFFRRYSRLELEEVSPLTLFVLCWVSQYEDEDELSKSLDPVLRCVVLLARRCNVRDNLQLTDKDLKIFLFRLGKMYDFLELVHYIFFDERSKYIVCRMILFKCGHLEIELGDQRMVHLATEMGILKTFHTGKRLLGYEAVHAIFLESLSKNFLEEVKKRFIKCSTDEDCENLREFLTFTSESSLTKSDARVTVHFPTNEDPFFIFSFLDAHQIDSRTGSLERIYPKFDLANIYAYKIVSDSNKCNMNETIFIPSVQKFCPEKKKNLFGLVMSSSRSLTAFFKDKLDSRIPKLTEEIFGRLGDQYSGSITVFLERKKQQENLVSLRKALDEIKDVVSVQALINEISRLLNRVLFDERIIMLTHSLPCHMMSTFVMAITAAMDKTTYGLSVSIIPHDVVGRDGTHSSDGQDHD